MANQDHVNKLKEGVHVWNQWRKDNPNVEPNLKGETIPSLNMSADINHELLAMGLQSGKALKDPQTALDAKNNYIGYDFKGADLRLTDFSGSNLQGAEFQEARLQGAKFQGADLTEANFCGAKVSGVEFDNKMKCRGIDVTGCTGSQRFVRHVMDLDYIEETKENHPVKYFAWSYTSDCGRCWELLLVWCVFTIGLFAVFFDWLGTQRSLISSVMAFTSFGFVDSSARSTGELVLICVEAMLGFTLFGCLVSLASSMMARRSS
jgi:hypothetical protein